MNGLASLARSKSERWPLLYLGKMQYLACESENGKQRQSHAEHNARATATRLAKEARLPGRNSRQPAGRQSPQAGQQTHLGGRGGAFPARHGKNLWRPAQRNHWRWTLIFCSTSPGRRILPTSSTSNFL